MWRPMHGLLHTFRDSGKRRWTFAALLFLGFAAARGESPTENAPHRWPAEAVIRFYGTSTLHDFGGTLPAQPFQLILSNNTWTAEADVRSGLMATAEAKRDRNMHAMMDTNDYPLLRGKVSAAPIPGPAGTNSVLRLKIRSQEADHPVRVTQWQETDSDIHFHAAWELSLKQYGLKPPSVLGFIRVGDKVRLDADVTVHKNVSTPGNPAKQP
jgi:hypothetical protein